MIGFIGNIDCFNDFVACIKPLPVKMKGDLFEELTKYIFMYHPNYCQFTKNIWLLDEMPINLLKKLGLPLRDEGIDLILQDKYDQYHAIQCKFRMNVDKVIPWGELGTFYGLSFGVSNGFAGGFYVTNTVDITKNAKRSTKVVPLYGDFFDDLTDFFTILKSKLIASIIHNNPAIIKPRSYQRKMIRKTIDHFKKNDRGIIEAACGTGKTLATYWIDKKMENRLTVVAVPSLFLLSQFYKDWAGQMQLEEDNADYILIGSDADFDEIQFENNGLIVTTSTLEIAKKMRYISKSDSYKIIIITTYQSSDKLIEALNLLNMEL